jgi:hypothetical protein
LYRRGRAIFGRIFVVRREISAIWQTYGSAAKEKCFRFGVLAAFAPSTATDRSMTTTERVEFSDRSAVSRGRSSSRSTPHSFQRRVAFRVKCLRAGDARLCDGLRPRRFVIAVGDRGTRAAASALGNTTGWPIGTIPRGVGGRGHLPGWLRCVAPGQHPSAAECARAGVDALPLRCRPCYRSRRLQFQTPSRDCELLGEVGDDPPQKVTATHAAPTASDWRDRLTKRIRRSFEALGLRALETQGP